MDGQRILIEGFTRQETLKLTGCDANRLSYLERVSLVVPSRIGGNKRPPMFFTWEQLLEIRAIKNLRKEVSLQTVRRIIEFLNQSGFDDSLRNKQLVVIDDEVLWVNPDWSDFHQKMPAALKVASKKRSEVGQYVLLVVPSFDEIINDIWNTAKSSTVIDFDSFRQRAKAKPA